MTYKSKNQIIWGIRILVSALFILSALAKLHPTPTLGIGAFETKYLGAVGIEYDTARILSRLLIGFEFSLAILLLLPFYLRKLIIPATIGLLSVFSIHLAVQAINGDASNCGCFGELIPMTPLQALIKNILTIGLLLIPITFLKDNYDDKKKFSPILIIVLASILSMFVFLIPAKASGFEAEADTKNTRLYNSIQKKKILCFFDPSCEHCMEAGKEIIQLKKANNDFPEVKILFMDAFDNGMKEEIDGFFKFIGEELDYQLLSIQEFNPIFWDKYQFPGILYMYEGEERIFFEATGNPFDSKRLMEEVNKDK